MKNYIIKSVIAASIILLSCGDDHQFFPDSFKTVSESARVRFVHAASDTVAANLYIGDFKVSGGAPSTITATGAVNIGRIGFGGDFPVVGYSYLSDPSGNIEIIVPEVYTAADTFPTKTLSTSGTALAASKNYTVALVGLSPTYETVVYEDNLATAPLNGKSYIRFANFIDNSTDGLALRGTPPVTPTNPTPTPVTFFPNVAYKGMSAFLELPQTGTYTNVQVINANTLAVVATLAAGSSAFIENKAYTIFARGRIGGAGAAVPAAGRMANR